MTTLGERLKILRGDSSQAEFAALFSIPQVTLGNYERNRNEPRFELVQRICIHFEINVEWLLFGTGPMRPGEQPISQSEASSMAPESCPRCAKLEKDLELERNERRELAQENRQLMREISNLRVDNAVQKEQLRALSGRSVAADIA